MDNHFEVILDRVKQLTEHTGVTVWFEIPESPKDVPVMILISEKNRIGMITVDYSDKIPVLKSYKLTKPIYDQLVLTGFALDGLEKYNKKTFDTAKLIKWVVESK
jgi:hypothetical protein